MFFAFVEKVPASVSNFENQASTKEVAPSQTSEMIIKSDDPYKEFQKILSKYSDLLKAKKYMEFGKKLTAEDKKRLNELFPQLTAEQRKESPILVFDGKGKLEKSIPKDAQLNEFLDAQKYGIWIDGKRVQNSVLKNYKSSDFSSVMTSIIHKNTVDYGKYKYHVSMMTNKYFEDYNSKENIQVGIKKDFSAKEDTIRPKSEKIKEGFPPPPPSVDVPAEFPGGLDKFRNLFAEKFDGKKLSDFDGLIKTTLYFNIDEKGNVSNFRAEGDNNTFNEEAIRTMKVVNGETVWRPATKYGKPVPFQFKLPLTMSFEKNPMPANYKK